MCSVGDDNFENDVENCMKKQDKIQICDLKCNKCRESKPCILLRSKDAYCQTCFLAGTVHKFKALLGKHRLIRPNDRVLILHKIGHASTALLHFIRTGLDLTTPKRLRFEPVVIYLDDQFQLSLSERENVLKDVREEVNKFNFNLQIVSFAAYVNSGGNISNSLVDNVTISNEDLSKIFDKKTNKTSKNDLITIYKRQLLIDLAKHLKCSFVFTPELSMDVASQLLTNISLGRGSHVPLDTGFCDDRDEEVKLLRPLRLFDIKELAFYNYLNNLQPVAIRHTKTNPNGSVQDLMKKFVDDLQANYPATVTTILKTGDKLAVNKDVILVEDKCALCKVSLSVENSGLSSAEATSFSHWISTQTPDHQITPQDRYNQSLETFVSQPCIRHCYTCSKIAPFILPEA